VQGQDSLAVFGKEHEIGFPMARNGAVLYLGRALGDGNTLFNMQGRTAALSSPPSSLGFGTGQKMAPGIVLVAGDLSGDETINRLRPQYSFALPAFKEPADLFRRPALA
jgi:hypothetical protein